MDVLDTADSVQDQGSDNIEIERRNRGSRCPKVTRQYISRLIYIEEP
jgi:hypothetical protein